MEPKYLISIVIPVYNVEKLICRCLDSILNQTYSNWELLLIDDGSKDSSGILCDSYSAKDDRIHVFHKENGGVSSARNLGIDKAQGEWIAFIDSDDYIKEDYLLEMVSSKCDLVACGFECSCGDIVKLKPGILETRCCGTAIGILMPGHPFYAPWGKLFRTSIIKEYNIYFDQKLHLAEDTIFCWEYLTKINTVHYIESTNYLYEGDPKDHSKYNTSFEENSQLAIRMGLCYDEMAKKAGGNIDYLKRWIPGRLMKTKGLIENHSDIECYELFKKNKENATPQEYVESIGKFILMYMAKPLSGELKKHDLKEVRSFFKLPSDAYSVTFSTKVFYKSLFYNSQIEHIFYNSVTMFLIQYYRVLKMLAQYKANSIQRDVK